jgi:predicted RNA-binding Zn-ribbon protein involved in translation (DUF1610 family)
MTNKDLYDVIDILNHAIPMRMKTRTNELGLPEQHCGRCDLGLIFFLPGTQELPTYCPRCGQKILWRNAKNVNHGV